ncbi:MAG: oligosaccharide flippase family protein [Fimbriimonadales bacterium]|nr:oligosaccharide flippase family protein [Fimbriimonadales bacterium]
MSSSLRQRAAFGTLYIALRRVLGIALGFAGLILLTRAVGPNAYGVFAAAIGVVGYLSLLGQMGVRMYLIRAPQDDLEALTHQAFSWLLTAGTGLALICTLIVAVIYQIGSSPSEFVLTTGVLAATIPVGLIGQVPGALLERGLEYKRTAIVEILAQLSFYAVGIPLAQWGYGVWALVGGQWAQLLTTTVGVFWASGYRPRWLWRRSLLKDMLGYSFTQAIAGWLYELRNLGLGFVLLPLAGAEVVGYYALAQRLLQLLSVIKEAVSRVSVPVYAYVQDSVDKLLLAICRSAQAQVLGLGVACLGMVLTGQWLLPLLFGAQWDIPMAMTMFAFLASEQILSAIFGAQAQALHVRRHSLVVAKIAAVFLVNFFTVATLAVWLLPSAWKGIGFATAYWLTHLPNNWLYHRLMPKYIGQPYYGMSLTWAVALSVALFAPVVSYWLLLGLAIFLLPASRRELTALLHELRPTPRGSAS